MPLYRVTGAVSGSKYLGEFEGNTAEEAIDQALTTAWVSLCHQCSSECEDPEVFQAFASRADGTKEATPERETVIGVEDLRRLRAIETAAVSALESIRSRRLRAGCTCLLCEIARSLALALIAPTQSGSQ